MTPITEPALHPAQRITDGWTALPSWLPVPGLGALPINAFLLTGRGGGCPHHSKNEVAPMDHDTTYIAQSDASQRRRTAKLLKTAQALVFLGLGGWCLLAPHMVETLSLRPEYQHLSATTALLMGCFGAQAVLCGSLIFLSRFTATTFLVFGLLASVPFFIFNAWFVWVSEMFTSLMLLDFAGNVSFLLIGILGWRLMRHEAEPV